MQTNIHHPLVIILSCNKPNRCTEYGCSVLSYPTVDTGGSAPVSSGEITDFNMAPPHMNSAQLGSAALRPSRTRARKYFAGLL